MNYNPVNIAITGDVFRLNGKPYNSKAFDIKYGVDNSVGLKWHGENEMLVQLTPLEHWTIDGNTPASVDALFNSIKDVLLFSNGGSVGNNGDTGYNPTFTVDGFNPNVVAINFTTQIKYSGNFLDFVNSVEAMAGDMTGVSVGIVSKSLNELIIELTTNGVEQNYEISISSPVQTQVINVQSANFSLIVPDPAEAGNLQFVKGTNGSNAAVLGVGTFEASNDGGNGWNEYAYFGAHTSTTRISYGFTLDRLQDASDAYGFIKTNSTNNLETGGNPRVYIQAGNSFIVYSPLNGAQIGSTTVAEGDEIEIVLEPNKYEVFKNGASVAVYNGAVDTTDIYMTITAFRILRLTNVNAKIY